MLGAGKPPEHSHIHHVFFRPFSLGGFKHLGHMVQPLVTHQQAESRFAQFSLPYVGMPVSAAAQSGQRVVGMHQPQPVQSRTDIQFAYGSIILCRVSQVISGTECMRRIKAYAIAFRHARSFNDSRQSGK